MVVVSPLTHRFLTHRSFHDSCKLTPPIKFWKMAALQNLKERGMNILCRVRNTTKEDVLSVYMPTLGGVSYSLFSINIMDANFRRNFSPDHEVLVSNGLWLNAHIGVGLYLYTRKHMVAMPVARKILFSTFGTVVFNFGSVLIWASAKSLLPRNTSLRVLVGIASSVAFLYLGKEYLDHVDRTTTESKVAEVEEKPTDVETK